MRKAGDRPRTAMKRGKGKSRVVLRTKVARLSLARKDVRETTSRSSSKSHAPFSPGALNERRDSSAKGRIREGGEQQGELKLGDLQGTAKRGAIKKA